MNEEEKKAIEYFEKSFKKRVPPYWYDDTIANNEEQIKVLLNLIEKQQKEIEDLNEKIIELKEKEIIKKSLIPTQEKFEDYYNYISKDKIKEKIEKYKVLAEKSKIKELLYIYKNVVYVLQELLEGK